MVKTSSISRSISFMLGALGLCLLCWACNEGTNEKEAVLLAKVYNKPLYLSELEGMVPAGSSVADSSLIVNAYVERWVRENLLMHEAEKNIPKDLNIDELVRDYRASLIRHNYEKLLVEHQMDSLVSPQELQQYYEEHLDQYLLKEPIVRCHYIKVVMDKKEEIKKLWDQNDEESYPQLLDLANHFASVYMLNDSTWYKAPDLIRQFPKGKVRENELSKGKTISFDHQGYAYFLRIFEVVPQNTQAPISYVSEQAKKVILYQRKSKLLDEKKEEIYERGLKMKNVEIYQY